MYLNLLDYNNLKSRSASLALRPFTLISGRNGTGKTGVHDAIALALMGHSPRLGKTAAATADLASKFPLNVMASTDTLKFAFNLTSGRTLKAESTGDDRPVMPAILFQPNLWLEASPAVRQKMIRDHIRGLEAEMVTIWSNLVNSLKECDEAIQKVAALKLESVEDRVSAIQTELEAKRKEEAALSKRFKETIQGLETLNLLAADVEETPDVDGLNDLVQTRLQLEGDAKSKLTDVQATMRAKRERIEEITAEIGEFPELPSPTLSALQQQLQTAKNDLEAVQAKLAEMKTIEGRVSQRATLLKEIATLRQKLVVNMPVIDDGDNVLAEQALDEAERKDVDDKLACLTHEFGLLIKARDKANEKHEASKTHAETCAHCGAAVEHWTRKPWEITLEELKQAQSAVETCNARINTAKSTLKVDDPRRAAKLKMADIATLNEKQQGTLDLIKHRETMIEELGGETVDAGAMMKLVEQKGNIQNEIEELSEMVGIYESRTRIPVLENEIEKIKGEIAALEGDEQRMKDGLTWDGEEITGLRQQLEEAKKQKAAIDRARGEKAQLTQAQEQFGESEERLAVIGANVELCKRANEQIAQCNIQPVIDMANRFLAGVFEWKLDKNGDALGYWQDLNWVPMKTFSGAQTKIVMAAIQAALAAEAPFKLLLLDEAVCIDRERSGVFYANVLEAIKQKVLDQAIILDMGTPVEQIESLSQSADFIHLSLD